MLYHPWEYSAHTSQTAIVRPDGCRDILVTVRDDDTDQIHITDLDTHPRHVRIDAGTKMTGFRLSPGTTLATRDVLAADLRDQNGIRDMIESEVRRDHDVAELIVALTRPNATIAQVARQNGTTARTLQRKFRQLSLPTPDFWRLLGRARRAIHALPTKVPLTEIALTYGYSDQAHMTREFMRWFGTSPSQLRRNPSEIAEICEPGLGNWLDDNRAELRALI